jgi:hypothetical protein
VVVIGALGSEPDPWRAAQFVTSSCGVVLRSAYLRQSFQVHSDQY